MTPKNIAKIIQETFFRERNVDCPWFVVGSSVSENKDQHFVLYAENNHCYCRVSLNPQDEIFYLKFFC